MAPEELACSGCMFTHSAFPNIFIPASEGCDAGGEAAPVIHDRRRALWCAVSKSTTNWASLFLFSSREDPSYGGTARLLVPLRERAAVPEPWFQVIQRDIERSSISGLRTVVLFRRCGVK